MNISKKQQDWIQQYFRAELKNSELKEFNHELASNDEFKREFIFQKHLDKATKLEAVRALMDNARLKNSLEQKQEDPRFKTIQNSIATARLKNTQDRQAYHVKKWLMLAASVVILSFIGFNHFQQNDIEKELSSIYNDIYNTANNTQEIVEVGGREDVINYKVLKLQEAYTTKRFSDALTIIEELRRPQYNYNAHDLLYYETVIYMQTSEYDKSLLLISNWLNENNSHNDELKWMRSLIYYKMNKKIKAKQEFEHLVVHSEKYKSKAQNILKKYF